jgi:4-hydroxybenzoate polyprenyltransferase
MKFLKLIRYKNLLMLAFMQLLFRFDFLKLQHIPLALNNWQYALLVLSTALIAAAGYVINDIFDQETDNINKPNKVIVGKSISENNAYSIYAALNITGVCIGFYLSNVIMKPSFATVFILIAATLYIYATSLKQMAVVGNIIVALTLSLSVIIIGVFDIYPATNSANQPLMANLFSVLVDYTVFAFMINLIREMIKDIEDIKGDEEQVMRTLPIIIGSSKTTKLIFAMSFVPIIALFYYVNNYFVSNNLFIATGYTFIFVLGPLFYCTIKIWRAKTKEDFHGISSLLKWILFFGILSIIIITLNINYNATR